MALTASRPTPMAAHPPRLQHQEVLASDGRAVAVQGDPVLPLRPPEAKVAQGPNAPRSSDQGAMRKSVAAKSSRSRCSWQSTILPKESPIADLVAASIEDNNLGALFEGCVPSCSTRSTRSKWTQALSPLDRGGFRRCPPYGVLRSISPLPPFRRYCAFSCAAMPTAL